MATDADCKKHGLTVLVLGIISLGVIVCHCRFSKQEVVPQCNQHENNSAASHTKFINYNLQLIQRIVTLLPGHGHARERLIIGLVIVDGKCATRNTDHDLDS